MSITFQNIVSTTQNIINSFFKKESKIETTIEVKNHFELGDIFVESWGYEQTNVDFYQVVKVNKASVVIQKIAYNTVKFTGWASDEVEPRKDCFIEEKTYTKRIKNGRDYLNGLACGYLSLHKGGRSYHRSWYA